jgi:glycosyltransferase involved in cell wall biosynthesis
MVEILLATYQGEKYLSPQLDSILSQSETGWRLLAHDDGSSDGTVRILRDYAARDSRIRLIDDGFRAGGAKANFAHLMAISTAPYVMFCDQDDWWEPRRVEIGLAALRAAEGRHLPGVPVVAFSDYRIVDESLRVRHPSAWRTQRNGPVTPLTASFLAVRSCMAGCTMSANRAAVAISLPIPDEAVMHDWWVGLQTLLHGGEAVPLTQPLVNYRQHAGNVVGAKSAGLHFFLGRLRQLPKLVADNASVYRMARHAGVVDNVAQYLKFKYSALQAATRSG